MTGEHASKPEVEQYLHDLEALVPEVMRLFRSLLNDGSPEDITVTPLQIHLLRKLAERGSCNASMIGDFMGITSGSVSSITDRLVRHGLVARTRDARDRRVVQFTLTEAGEKTLRIARARRRDKLRRMFERMGTEQSVKFVSVLKDVRDVLADISQSREDQA